MSSAMDDFNAIIEGIDFKETYEPMKCDECEKFRITIRKSQEIMRAAWGRNAYQYSISLTTRENIYKRLGMHENKDHTPDKGDLHS